MDKRGAYEAQPLTEELSHLSLRLWPLTFWFLMVSGWTHSHHTKAALTAHTCEIKLMEAELEGIITMHCIYALVSQRIS